MNQNNKMVFKNRSSYTSQFKCVNAEFFFLSKRIDIHSFKFIEYIRIKYKFNIAKNKKEAGE